MEHLFDVAYDRSEGGSGRWPAPDAPGNGGPAPAVRDEGSVRPRPPLASDPRRPVRQPDPRPLTVRMRPRGLAAFVGQQHLLALGRPLRDLLERHEAPPLVLWGPPGTGKSSLAAVVADRAEATLVELSGGAARPEDVARVVDDALERQRSGGGRTLLFLDDIQRCPAAHQEALLPLVEDGTLLLVGATTQNPIFDSTAPLIRISEVVELAPLTAEDLHTILDRAVHEVARGHGRDVVVTPAGRRALVASAGGDARHLLDALERAVARAEPGPDGALHVGDGDVGTAGDGPDLDGGPRTAHTAAFVRSLRAGDPDGAVYWMLRMLEAGEDPRAVARRLVVFASEQVGLADREALPVAIAAAEAVERVGLPDSRLGLVHAALVLATAEKSDSVARALARGLQAVEESGSADVPARLRQGPGPGATRPGRGAGYASRNAPAADERPASHLPDKLHGRRIYEPGRAGDEAAIAERVDAWRAELDAASSRLHAARARHQGGFIEGLGRTTWRDEPRQDARGTDPRDFGRDA